MSSPESVPESSPEPAPSIGAMIRRDVAPEDVPAHAAAISHGFDELWVVEDLPYGGGISQMSGVLDATAAADGSGPLIGHGIAPAPFRHPAALAMEWATLARLHPGRVAAGIGHGVPGWMAQIGQRVDSPLTLLAETIDAVQRLLAGELVTVEGRYVHLDAVRLEFPPTAPIAVAAGVLGPKSLALAGRVAGGTILPEGQGPDEIAAARSIIDEGRSEAGRADPHRLTVFTGFYCGPLDELGPPPPGMPSGWEAIGETPDEVAGLLAEQFGSGLDSMVLVPFGTDPLKQLILAADELVPRLTP